MADVWVSLLVGGILLLIGYGAAPGVRSDTPQGI